MRYFDENPDKVGVYGDLKYVSNRDPLRIVRELAFMWLSKKACCAGAGCRRINLILAAKRLHGIGWL